MESIPIPKSYHKEVVEFEKYFLPGEIIVCPDRIPQNLKPRNLRICRFCNKHYPDVKFRNDAHVFPKALGNYFFISDFECDACNSLFSRYEDDLMKFIGISRTLSKSRGRKANPRFISKDIKVYPEILFDKHKVIKIDSPSPSQNFEYDPEALKQTIRYTKPPYIPLNVFKAIYKMALSVIDDNEVGNYYLGYEFLKPTFPMKFKTGLLMHIYRLPTKYAQVGALLFKRRNSTTNTFSHSFVLLYDSFMFQILLPFHRSDFSRKKKIDFPICPPLFDGTGEPKLRHLANNFFELSSNEVMNDDEEKLILDFDLTELDKTIGFDMKNGQFINSMFDPKNIVGFYITDEDFIIERNT